MRIESIMSVYLIDHVAKTFSQCFNFQSFKINYKEDFDSFSNCQNFSSQQEAFHKKRVLKSFAKFTEQAMYWNSIINKTEDWKQLFVLSTVGCFKKTNKPSNSCVT